MEHQSRYGGAKVRFPPPLVFLAALLLGVLAASVWPSTCAGVPCRVTGIVVFLLGVALLAWAVRPFRRTGQRPEPWLPSPEMIVDGPYRYSRNPMYLAMTLITMGLGFFFGSFLTVGLALLALAIVHAIAVLPEERYLAEKFGAPYVEYGRRVRRYL